MDTDASATLLPCAICARTFMPQSLQKHIKICERAAAKKRRPFDSAKQRIQGTELAEFLPKQDKRRNHPEERATTTTATTTSTSQAKTSWKQNHDEFLRAIRAARSEIVEDPAGQKQCNTPSTSTPARANDQGKCPTCNRHFGIKAYERHVAWCKERSTRVQMSPSTNVAKERLEARMKYRAPSLKSRRAVTREKYAPGSAMTLSSVTKVSPTLSATKVKECASTPSCNKIVDAPIKPKSTLVKRHGPTKETYPSSVGPMKSRPIERTDGGTCKDYDPFLLAEQQMNDLLSDTSESVNASSTRSPSIGQTSSTLIPLTHSSAFVKYPYQIPSLNPDKRSSLIAPPTEFDDLTSDFSSDSTETNSLSREVFLKDLKESQELKDSLFGSPEKKSPTRELGRRVIIDKSKALGEVVENCAANKSFIGKVSSKVLLRPNVNRSLSVRASSAPKTMPDRKNSINTNGVRRSSQGSNNEPDKNTSLNNRNNNNYCNNNIALSSSNLSLSSIVSSEVDMKRSHSVFEELMTSFEDDNGSFPSLRSLLKNDSLSMSSPAHGRQQRNGQMSDGESSSPETYKRQDHSKLSADSAYSSLNRKYSHHGRSTNDMAARLDENPPLKNHRKDNEDTTTKCKMPNFCYMCGTKFQANAKFCCECGLERLAL